MAYAGAEFALKIVRAAKGETGIVAPSYVYLDDAAKKLVGVDTDFFSARVELGVRTFGTSTSVMAHLYLTVRWR